MKNTLIIAVISTMLIAAFAIYLNRGSEIVNTTHVIPSAPLGTETVIEKNKLLTTGLTKNEWGKTIESYCARGSSYYTVDYNKDDSLVLDFSEKFTEKEIQSFEDRTIIIHGDLIEKTIECPKNQQCPVTADGGYKCKILKLNSIKEALITN